MGDAGGSRTGESAFDRWRPRVGLIAGPLLGLLVYALAGGAAITPQARALAGVMTLTVVYWICEPIPLAATALLGPWLCIVTGVSDVKTAVGPFASPVIFLFMGSFILAEGVRKHGLDRRLALRVLAWRWASASPTATLAAVGLVAGFISMWMSNTATAALLLPVVLGLIQANPQLADKRTAASLLLMVSYAATAGGLATPIGTPPNLIGIGFIRELAHERISFLQWMGFGLPLSAALIAFLVLLLRPWGARGAASAPPPDFRPEWQALPPLSRGERNVMLVFFAALACWVFPGLAEMIGGEGALGAGWFGRHLPEEMVGLGAGLALFLLPVDLRRFEFTVSWREAAGIDWGTILLFGGGMSLGQQIFATGLAGAVSTAAVSALGAPGPWLLAAVAIVLSIALSELASNTASANVMIPLMIGLAQASGASVMPIAAATCLASSFGFMLPVSTPPNAIVYGSGRVPLPRMMATGIVFDVVGALAVWLAVRLAAAGMGW